MDNKRLMKWVEKDRWGWKNFRGQGCEERSSKPKWFQRDLEDQINEEKQENMRVVSNVSTRTTQTIDPKEVLVLLKEGYTRYKKHDKGYGSIQEKYNLSGLAVVKLFKAPLLKFKKTVVPEFILEAGVKEVPTAGAALESTKGDYISSSHLSEEPLFS